MMTRTLSAVALLSLAATTLIAAAPAASAGPEPCLTAEDAVNNTANWFTGSTSAELEAWLEDMTCPSEGISDALCWLFGVFYCRIVYDEVLAVDDAVADLVDPIYEQEGGLGAGGVAIVFSGSRGIQAKEQCGTYWERQLNCRTSSVSMPAMPTMPTMPAVPRPALPESPIVLSIGVGPVLLELPGCMYFEGDANCL